MLQRSPSVSRLCSKVIPAGPRAAASIYWGARVQELGSEAEAMSEFIALVQRFPVDYYAHRAGDFIAEKAELQVVTPAASLPAAHTNHQLSHVQGLLKAELTSAERTPASSPPMAYDALGPDDLELG